jgi:membrane dipeptidase
MKITRAQFIGAYLGFSFLSSARLAGSPLFRIISGSQDEFHMSQAMKNAYEIALKILKPTRSELEHGLELHRNSIVFETYGFQPTAAPDGMKIAKAISENASQIELQDLREEMQMTGFVHDQREREEYENAWKASGVTCVFQNAGEEGNEVGRLLKRLARYTYVTDMMKYFVSKAVTPEDIIRAKKENRRVLYFSGNGVPLPQDWVSAEEELRFIRIFYQLGIRMMHLTYNRRNMIGDGCAEPSNGGLSDFGCAVVKEMNRVGVIVDVAHSSWQTSLEAAKLSARPMVASHTTAASLHEHIRSKPDDVIRAIADTGGYVGICCIPRFLGGTGDIAAMMKHIDYVARKFGFDHVGIGTDKAHRSQYAAEEYEKIPSYCRPRPRWEGLWPPDDFKTKPEMVQSMAWTNWPLYTVGLVQLGYSDRDIQKIIGGNALRVAQAALA